MYESTALQEEDLNSLEHYGVKGQKWGQRNYQNPDGTYTELGKERRRVAFIREEKAKKEAEDQNKSETEDIKIGGKTYAQMTRKERREAKKRARHNEAERRATREFNREKRQALEEGNIAFISKNISKFSNDEINDAIIRYKTMQNLKDLDKATKKDAKHFMDKAIKFLEGADKATSLVSNMITKTSNASSAVANKKKAWQELAYLKDPNSKPLTEKEKIELQWLKNPGAKPLTEAERLKNEKQKSENTKSANEAKQTEIDTRWKQFTDWEKSRDYVNLSVEDFKNKWGSYDNSGGGKQKGKGDNSSGKSNKISKEDAISKSKSVDWEDEDSVSKFLDDMGFSGQSKKQKIGSWFSKKDKDKVNKDTNSDFDPDDKGINVMTRKYLEQLKQSPTDYFKEDKVRNDQWKKDLNKHDAAVVEKWIKDMKKKYVKERNMDSKSAEQKAEEYVEGWLEAYDEDLIKEMKKYL